MLHNEGRHLEQLAMPKRRLTITVILVFFLLLSAAPGQTAAAAQVHGGDALGVVQRHSRRLLTEIQDYDYGGSNSKHDPRRKPGNGH
ncbi:hypothetical protein U9M48_044745 [Paspalum notatum var. saurae]|uniref:Uncharacterized protein n=1 Tax=Paspalum notatum var. saurae TaxID=547442 RepID=A0AAQ3UVN6_PASNO